ncbi:putative PEX23 peroxisomal biogenesis factor 23 [Podospora fimiseda]|uniref:PEX23 peroxisomal biogenesis factor 23 n=1 Tax=Podospora fimiseda TaxID=252190 RepID=A0AAN7H1F9_9PEZI|nr:putative PEX23 peroxisomal biogenesis factor 23 [Podospora fimiseda]
MAAFDPPWLSHMSAPRAQRSSDTLNNNTSSSQQQPTTPSRDAGPTPSSSVFGTSAPNNPTYATFSPATLNSTSTTIAAAKRRSTILVHQKSPLLLATPPQITRALAYSHPFLLPLNRLVGLLTWTTGDPWESFLMVGGYWFVVLYGDILVRTAGPVILVLLLIIGMYGRRFSPLSSSGWSEPGQGQDGGVVHSGEGSGKGGKNLSVDGIVEKGTENGNATSTGGGGGHKRNQGSISENTTTRHQKTLDEIVDNLKEFTARCNILLEPLLELTDFLSTQQTPTSATTRPALTTLFVRILLCTPFWFLLTLPPMRIITTRRVILLFGTIVLTWHARVIRVTREILWRSASIRRLASLLTGLHFEIPVKKGAAADSVEVAANGNGSAKNKSKSGAVNAGSSGKGSSRGHESELTKALRRARGGHDTGVRFTFIIYENQRRWVGLGWTTSLFAYERPAWTDEHNNVVPQRDEFELPEVEDGSNMRWRWVEGSRWKVDGVPDDAVITEDGEGKTGWDYDGPGGKQGWVYYDNKWQNGRRGQDGWGRWTRRRKWYRDAELVETDMVEDEIVQTQPSSQAGMKYGDGSNNPTPRAVSRSAADSIMSPASTTTDIATPEIYYSSSPRSSNLSTLFINKTRGGGDKDKEEEYDSASLLSTSSKSTTNTKGKMSGLAALRRKVTDNTSLRGGSSRRASSGGSGTTPSTDDDAAIMSLGTSTRLALQDAGKEGSQWGVGDELRMGLE